MALGDFREQLITDLVMHPNVPEDLLVAMAATHDAETQRRMLSPYGALAPKVFQVLADSPHTLVRLGLGRVSGVPDDVLVRLARDPVPDVRWDLLSRPRWVRATLARYNPPEVYEILAADESRNVQHRLLASAEAPEEVRRAAAVRLGCPDVFDLYRGDDVTAARAHARLAADPDLWTWVVECDRFPIPAPLVPRLIADDRSRRPEVIVRMQLTAETAATLAGDPDRNVRFALARNPSLPAETVPVLLADDDFAVRWLAAANPALPAELLRRLAADPDRDVRAMVASNPGLPADVLVDLAQDEDLDVRLGVASQPGLPAGMLTKYLYHDVAGHLERLDWVVEAPLDEVLHYASSDSLMHRYSLAHRTDLPDDVVATLAAHGAPEVRFEVARSNRDRVPVSLLVELLWSGMGIGHREPAAVAFADDPRLPGFLFEELLRSPRKGHREVVFASRWMDAERLARLAEDKDEEIAAVARRRRPRTFDEMTAKVAADLADPKRRRQAAAAKDLPAELLWRIWRESAPA
ncbi:hypothetical protein [Dactylosporangium sp. NPDC005555]|uniref:hypothetical protein n=1 Tax=Dactylosporangium sp. NPDC005555 TaxID=3154889 RepID=UPI0033A734F4